ncbi:hypothetical protein [Thiocapsa sp.]|uniref:hypothetical protein n=1 Tax=Thiocapsa sp. TaxID=2024551 RepID=UPI00261D667F|nr:hypothetical protein [Thiocapsa sp.]
MVANERAGFLVSETGAGYTWCRNSQANRLTPWFNDPAAGDFAGAIVFAATLVTSGRVEPVGLTCDRAAFIGRHRDLVSPAAVLSGDDLCGAAQSDSDGSGPDACFAQQSRIQLAPGETAECVFLLGECLDEAELEALLARYRRANAVAEALSEVRGFWTDLTDALRVETPSPAIDLMLNGWLTYQNLACR